MSVQGDGVLLLLEAVLPDLLRGVLQCLIVLLLDGLLELGGAFERGDVLVCLRERRLELEVGRLAGVR